jgi:hypothetical protein
MTAVNRISAMFNKILHVLKNQLHILLQISVHLQQMGKLISFRKEKKGFLRIQMG